MQCLKQGVQYMFLHFAAVHVKDTEIQYIPLHAYIYKCIRAASRQFKWSTGLLMCWQWTGACPVLVCCWGLCSGVEGHIHQLREAEGSPWWLQIHGPRSHLCRCMHPHCTPMHRVCIGNNETWGGGSTVHLDVNRWHSCSWLDQT